MDQLAFSVGLIFGLMVTAVLIPNVAQACSADCAVGCDGTGARKCVECNPGFGFNVNGSCAPCKPSTAYGCTEGCKVNGAGRCDGCSQGFGLTNNSTACNPCVPNCLSCDTNITYCDVCFASYYFYPNRTCGLCSDNCTQHKCQSNGAGKCDQCDLGYGLTATNTCALCASNCTTCAVNGPWKCDQCDKGFALTSMKNCTPICASNCTTCAVNGPWKCDQCDQGFALTSMKNCTPTSAVQTTSRIFAGAGGSRTLSRNFTSVSDWTSAMTTWIMPVGDTTTCPMLAIGLGLGVPCGLIIIVLLIIITVLCVQNRSLREYKKQSQDSKQSHAINSRASNITLQPPLTPYQHLKTENTQREYEPIDRYDAISTTETETTGHYETPIN